MKILYVTRLNQGSTGFGYLHGFRDLGHDVKEIDTSIWLGNWEYSIWERVAIKLRKTQLPMNRIKDMNQTIMDVADEFKPDLTFFVGAPYILPETLIRTRKYGLNFCHFQDDMFNPSCQTFSFFDDLPYWDCVFITRKCNLDEFKQVGVTNVVFVHKAWTPGLYRPIKPSTDEYEKYKGDVIFIGSFNSPERGDYLAEIIHRCPDVRFNIWGGGWNMWKRPYFWLKLRRWKTWPSMIKAIHYSSLYYDEMSKAMNANKIVLGFLNHKNRDLHTSRTLEIPACGGFMLMERTEEHQQMFEEGQEAEYFDNVDEAVQKIEFYLAHEEIRTKIAQAGHIRLLNSQHSYHDRAQKVIQVYEQMHK